MALPRDHAHAPARAPDTPLLHVLGRCHTQMQDLILGVLCAGAMLVMVLGVLSSWVMSSYQSRLLW